MENQSTLIRLRTSWTESEKQDRRSTAALMQFQLMQLIAGAKSTETAKQGAFPNTQKAKS